MHDNSMPDHCNGEVLVDRSRGRESPAGDAKTSSVIYRSQSGAAPVWNIIGPGDRGRYQQWNVLGCRLLTVTLHLETGASCRHLGINVYIITSASLPYQYTPHVKQRK